MLAAAGGSALLEVTAGIIFQQVKQVFNALNNHNIDHKISAQTDQ